MILQESIQPFSKSLYGLFAVHTKLASTRSSPRRPCHPVMHPLYFRNLVFHSTWPSPSYPFFPTLPLTHLINTFLLPLSALLLRFLPPPLICFHCFCAFEQGQIQSLPHSHFFPLALSVLACSFISYSVLPLPLLPLTAFFCAIALDWGCEEVFLFIYQSPTLMRSCRV